MKRVILATLLLGTSALATAAEYVKPNGSLSLVAGGNGVEFNINAASKDASGICNIGKRKVSAVLTAIYW